MQATTDARVDVYIDKAAPFAKPVLQHLRALIHTACPGVTETIKWGMPFFEYKGILCNMAGFKQHCSFGFFKAGSMIQLPELLSTGEPAMGDLGKIRSLKDLPPDDVLINCIKEVAAYNEKGVKKAAPEKSKTSKALLVPDAVTKALESHAAAKNTFDNFAYSHKKEYLQWIAEAKTEATRNKRIATMIEWLQEGKSRNWKYEERKK